MDIDRKAQYREFLDSGFWKILSIKKKHSVGNCCEYCKNTNNLDSHHLFYRKNWFDTKLSDLMVLCKDCHKKVHDGLIILKTTNNKEVEKPNKPIKYKNKTLASLRRSLTMLSGNLLRYPSKRAKTLQKIKRTEDKIANITNNLDKNAIYKE